MKVYDKEGRSMNAVKDQMSVLLDSGWSLTKPEAEEEPALDPVSDPVPAKKEPEPVKEKSTKPKVKVKIKTTKKIPSKK